MTWTVAGDALIPTTVYAGQIIATMFAVPGSGSLGITCRFSGAHPNESFGIVWDIVRQVWTRTY